MTMNSNSVVKGSDILENKAISEIKEVLVRGV